MSASFFEKSVAYLKSDPLKHLTTLKFISLYQKSVTLTLLEDAPPGAAPNWALSVTIPTQVLPYDTATYPDSKVAVFMNGNSEPLKQRVLEALPPNNYVLRLNEGLDLSALEKRFHIKAGNSYVSYSGLTVPESPIHGLIPGSPRITDEGIDLIQRNGYTEAEIRKYFDQGAVWFGLMIQGRVRSGCFIYQNYEDIWEIAGVHTLEADRNQGYAKIVVTSALTYLLQRKLVPRYDVSIQNIRSMKLAEGLGMKEFLRINHLLLYSVT